VILVTQDADYLSRQSVVQQFDDRFSIGTISLSYCAFFDVFAGTLTHGLYIGDKIASRHIPSSQVLFLRRAMQLSIPTDGSIKSDDVTYVDWCRI
jgi:hypothetical protein